MKHHSFRICDDSSRAWAKAYPAFILLAQTVSLHKSSNKLLKRKTIFEGRPRTAETFIKLQTLILAILNSILKGFGGSPPCAKVNCLSSYYMHFHTQNHIAFQIFAMLNWLLIHPDFLCLS